MQLILDTHALIWWWGGDSRLPKGMRELIAERDTIAYISAASVLEIAIKVRLGKLPEMATRIGSFHEAVCDDGFTHLNLHYDHALLAGSLPGEHRDPFDRAIAAQGLYERLPVVTRDPAIAGFGCETLW